ncbi:MAG: DUF444 family protein [Alphaproteobacteria bacterium]
MTVIRDRRHEPANDKFGTDIDRFKRRVLDQVKKAIQNDITEGALNDIGRGAIKVPIPKQLTREPFLHFTGTAKNFKRVFPGNKGLIPAFSPASGLPSAYPGNISFDVGDKIPVPKGGGGGGGGKGSGEGSDQDADDNDDFVWINEADYLNILFDGRSLPDMTKLKSKDTTLLSLKQAGQISQGPFTRLNIPITNKKRRQEELVLNKGNERRIFETLAEQFNILSKTDANIGELEIVGIAADERNEIVLEKCKELLSKADHINLSDINPSESKQVIELFQQAIDFLRQKNTESLKPDDQEMLDILEQRLEEQFRIGSKIGRFRDEHLTYNFDKPKPKPNAKAVMFCLMDVSGSMGQEEKNTAKVFFWLLKKFLDANYKKVDLVFIAHTTQAKEVSEKEFFYGTETGGTIVSSCLQKTLEILKERYSLDEWNIYSAQASDGDNAPSDNQQLVMKMNELLPMLQAHYYLEVASPWRGHRPSEMYGVYNRLSQETNGKVQATWGVRNAPGALEAFKKFFPIGAKPTAQAAPGL